MSRLTLGYSPCPNDTFIFHALTHGLIANDVEIAPVFHEDVETLNLWAMEKRLDITKMSFHALGHVLDEYCVLRSGSALGRGCGPLLVARRPIDLRRKALRIAIPGKYTTAAMLFQMFAPGCSNLIEMRFEQIMEGIDKGEVDAGVIIHESRFTYQALGLICLQDLGQWWEESSGQPIPLGCIAARRSLGNEKIGAIDDAIRRSLEYGYAHPGASLAYIRQHAQEIDDTVTRQHIDLYVNDFSLDLGEEGEAAVEAFLERGRQSGALPACDYPVVFRGGKW